jgi:Bacterial membrane protein YfhO
LSGWDWRGGVRAELRRLKHGRGVAATFLAATVPDLLALTLLLVATIYLFRDALTDGLVFHEADTTTMFYPIFAALGAALGRGEQLLWSPDMFSGFPLLAEGQTGVLYPPNRLAAALLPTRDGFIWLRIGHFALANLGTYGFGRSLRLAPGPALIMAMSFGFGSFMVGQLQHASVIASAAWLPSILALVELGFRARRLARLRYVVLAGLALGMAALGVHVQTVVMTGGCFVGWVLFRLVVPPGPLVQDRPGPRASSPGGSTLSLGAWRAARVLGGRLVVAGSMMALVPALSMAVAAAQLLPLYELSGESGRAGSWTYQTATDYSLPLQNLLTLIFPFFFRDGQGGGWSLWQPWEVTFYAGVIPLMLGVPGAVWGRRREVLFFGPLLVIATLLALGDYSPLNLYASVWNLPGINLNRAPARYSYLGVLAIAGLGGLGAQVLWMNLRTWPNGVRRSCRFLLVWQVGLVVALAALIWHLVIWRSWLGREPPWALQTIEQSYLSLRHDAGAVDSAQQVYSGLWRALDLTNRHTVLPLLLLAALLLLLVCWNELRRARAVWMTGLVLLVAADLLNFAQQYHPLVALDAITDVGESGRFLARQSGLVRIYSSPDVQRPRANQLLPWEIDEVRAYDPLELSRNRVFLGSVGYVDNWLLDLLGVRFRLAATDPPGFPSYRQTGFDPQHPLVSGAAYGPAGRESWTVPGDQADELRVVSVLNDAFGLAEGEPAGEWTLTDTQGRTRTFTMLAGRDTADWAYDDPILTTRPAHGRARVAFSFDLSAALPNGAHQVNLYYTAFPLPDRPSIARVEFRQLSRLGRLQVFGFGLFNQDRRLVAQFYDREKYRTVFQEPGVIVQENRAAFPRAFAVPGAVVVETPNDAMELLVHGPLQPRQQVVLEQSEIDGEVSPAAGLPRPAPLADPLGASYGDVQIQDYGDQVVAIRAVTDGGYLVLTDAYYPGWRVYVDGQETRLLHADYLFRGARLEPGEHLVLFRYMPESYEMGAQISRIALALAALVLLVSWVPAVRVGRLSWLRPGSR